MKNAIEVTIDSAGRLVIPKQIRELLGLYPGVPWELSVRDQSLEMVPKPISVRIEKRGKLHVAVPLAKSSLLEQETVKETTRRLRERD